jgi:hypothetical protein
MSLVNVGAGTNWAEADAVPSSAHKLNAKNGRNDDMNPPESDASGSEVFDPNASAMPGGTHAENVRNPRRRG